MELYACVDNKLALLKNNTIYLFDQPANTFRSYNEIKPYKIHDFTITKNIKYAISTPSSIVKAFEFISHVSFNISITNIIFNPHSSLTEYATLNIYGKKQLSCGVSFNDSRSHAVFQCKNSPTHQEVSVYVHKLRVVDYCDECIPHLFRHTIISRLTANPYESLSFDMNHENKMLVIAKDAKTINEMNLWWSKMRNNELIIFKYNSKLSQCISWTKKSTPMISELLKCLLIQKYKYILIRCKNKNHSYEISFDEMNTKIFIYKKKVAPTVTTKIHKFGRVVEVTQSADVTSTLSAIIDII